MSVDNTRMLQSPKHHLPSGWSALSRPKCKTSMWDCVELHQQMERLYAYVKYDPLEPPNPPLKWLIWA
eukprot:1216426-Amphidinium_carterae.1